MSKTLRLVLSSLLVVVFAFSLAVTLMQDAQAAKQDYTCCKYMHKEGPIRQLVYGVWFNNECHCIVDHPDQNPNGCTLDCYDPQ